MPPEIRNPNSEIRRKAEIRNPKKSPVLLETQSWGQCFLKANLNAEARKTQRFELSGLLCTAYAPTCSRAAKIPAFGFRISVFGVPSVLGPRPSDFCHFRRKL